MPEIPALSHRASSQTETDEPQLAFEVPPNVLGDVDVLAGGGNKTALDSSATESDSTGESEFREGGYGWVVVLSVLLINAHTWGFNSSYAVFLAYYLRSGAIAGASPLAFAFVGGLSISIAFLVSPLATLCIGRFGTRATLRIGVGFEAVSFIGASFTSQTWHLLLSQGICFGTGMGFCFTATVGVVPQWFTKRRSLANAISTSGSGFGGLMYSLATNAMISNLGLPWAFRILAILAIVVNGVCSLLVRDRNKAVGSVHVAFHGALFRRLEFWLFLGWGFFSIISYIIVVFSLTDYSQHVGFSASQGSLVAALFNLSQGLGRILIGFIGDRFGIMNVAGLGTLAAGLAALFIWILAGQHYAGVVVYALFGIVAGIIWPTVAPVGVEVIGLQLLPSALSIYWLVLVLPATFAEVIGLSMRKPGVDGYIDVQVFTGILYLVSFVSIWLLRSWKLRQIEALTMEGEHQVASTPRKGDAATVTPGGAEKKPAIVQEPGLLRAYLTNMFAIKHV